MKIGDIVYLKSQPHIVGKVIAIDDGDRVTIDRHDICGLLTVDEVDLVKRGVWTYVGYNG